MEATKLLYGCKEPSEIAKLIKQKMKSKKDLFPKTYGEGWSDLAQQSRACILP